MGFYTTVDEGERIALWSRNGKLTLVDGPKRIGTAFKRVEHLRKNFADHTEYLRVVHKDGRVEIVPGPCALFKDPVAHASISSIPAMMLDANEVLVVYKSGQGAVAAAAAAGGNEEKPDERAAQTSDVVLADRVLRRIVRGPARFIPMADEWVHKFEWSGQPKDGSKTSYQPKALQFTHLRVVPSSAYHNVNEVRTNDDTLITVKLMLFFELRDIETMLDATNDPIGDFINAASADVIAFCATQSYEGFLNETHKLNQLATFEQLCSRARHVGYEVTKVVFRGFQAGARLQDMHDSAIQERTRLRLLEETQEQQQRAADIELHAKQRRAAQQAELAASEAQQRAELSMMSKKAALAEQEMADVAAMGRARREHETEREHERAQAEAELLRERQKLELMQARDAEQLHMMREMHALGVDLTKVLVSQHEQPDRVIKLETPGEGKGGDKAAAGSGKGLLGALQLNL